MTARRPPALPSRRPSPPAACPRRPSGSAGARPALVVVPLLIAALAPAVVRAQGVEPAAAAQDSGVRTADRPADDRGRPVQPLWEVGLFGFGLSQQAYPGSDQQVGRVLVLPFAVYRGAFVRADRETTGVRALRTPRVEVDIGVAGSFGSSASDIEARRGMRNLGTLVEAGPRVRWNLGRVGDGRVRLDLPVRGVFDLSDSLARRGTAVEPELNWQRRAGPWTWDASAGVLFADRRLAATFYGVSPAEATVTRPSWDARSGRVAWRLGGSVGREIGPDWRVFGFVRVDSVAGAANAGSPLVRDRVGASVGLGAAWTGLRSSRPAVD